MQAVALRNKRRRRRQDAGANGANLRLCAADLSSLRLAAEESDRLRRRALLEEIMRRRLAAAGDRGERRNIRYAMLSKVPEHSRLLSFPCRLENRREGTRECLIQVEFALITSQHSESVLLEGPVVSSGD